MKPRAALLFAAGLGTRMAPLTDDRPKPLIKVAGKALLDHAIEQCGDLRLVVNAHYFAEQIETHIAGRGIDLSDETDLLRETGGGLKHALPLLGDGPVMTMNTDAAWRGPPAVDPLLGSWGDKMDALLLMVPKDRAIGHTGTGDFDIGPDGRLTRGTGYVYSGAQIIRTDGLTDIQEDVFSMWALWDGILQQGTMYGVAYDGLWCDVGRPDCIPMAEAILEGHDV